MDREVPHGGLTSDWIPEGVDWRAPSAARVYDAHLGGAHNFAVDRDVAARIARIMPDLPVLLRANRSFLRRVVQYLVHQGVRQFLDLGSGIPTVGNVHEVAQGLDPECRVVYVDIDPVAAAHSRRLLDGNDRAIAIQADLRDADAILTAEPVTGLLDFSQPVAVLMLAALHFVPDTAHPNEIVGRYLRDLVSGCYLAISHGTGVTTPSGGNGVDAATALYSKSVEEFHLRDLAQVTALFGDLELIEPGVVPVSEWHPDDPEEASTTANLPQLCGLARKP